MEQKQNLQKQTTNIIVGLQESKHREYSDAVKHFKTLLECDQFLVTGGMALHAVGLYKNYNDLDILLVNPSEESKKLIRKLMEASPAKTKCDKYSEAEIGLIGITQFGNIKVDFFSTYTQSGVRVKHLTTPCGLDITLPEWSFEFKRKANRPKDWIDLYGIAKSICDKDEFLNKMMTSNK